MLGYYRTELSKTIMDALSILCASCVPIFYEGHLINLLRDKRVKG
jgi:hypothetical protein